MRREALKPFGTLLSPSLSKSCPSKRSQAPSLRAVCLARHLLLFLHFNVKGGLREGNLLLDCQRLFDFLVLRVLPLVVGVLSVAIHDFLHVLSVHDRLRLNVSQLLDLQVKIFDRSVQRVNFLPQSIDFYFELLVLFVELGNEFFQFFDRLRTL